jgi:O-antigen ligase
VAIGNIDPSSNSVRRRLILFAVLTLPFTLALTVNLRFPLKLYELALLGAGLTCLAQFRIPTLRPASRAGLWVALLVGWALAVLLLHAWLPPSGLSTSGVPTRFGPLGDGIAKIMYLLLSLFGFLQIAERTYWEERVVLRYWLIGAMAAAIYAWYLFGSTLLGRAPFLLPGIDSPQLYNFGNSVVIRSGTFDEGNFMGLYLVTSTMVALYAKRPLVAAFLAATVLISFSTVNFAALALLSAVLIWRGPARMSAGRKTAAVLAGILVLVGVGALLLGTGYLESVISEKLVGPSLISRLDRVGTALTGLRMFGDHPVTGVGVSQFGFYYNAYEALNLAAFNIFPLEKRIANNVYVELLSELGIVGFAIFLLFLTRIWRHLRGRRALPLRLGFLAMLLVWNAFPSYSLMFLWAFWGVIVGVSTRAAEQRTYRPSAPGKQVAAIH